MVKQHSTIALIKNAFSEKLGVQVSSTECIHRLGGKCQGHNRPIPLRLYDFREKSKVLQNCHKLKGSLISINEGFPLYTKQTRKRMWESALPIKREGGTLVYHKIRINDKLYFWDAVNDRKVPCDPRTAVTQP